MPKLRKVLMAGVPILIAAVLTAGATVYAQRGNGTRSPGPGNAVSVEHGSGNCINLGGQSMTCNAAPSNAATSNPAESVRTGDAPVGPGPWAFRVFDTVLEGRDLGLTVRSCPYRNCGCSTPHCEKLGFSRNGSLLYALCRLDSGFNGNDTTTEWLKITWPKNRPGDVGVRSSSPHDPFLGWVLAKYATPAGHNGEIPVCR